MPTPPTIPYASVPVVQDIIIEHDAHHLRIIIPPAPNWKLLAKTHGIALLILLALLGGIVGAMLSDRRIYWPAVLVNTAIYGLAIAGVLVSAIVRMRRWITFTVTADRFLLNKRIFTADGETTSWPRGAIAGAKFAADSGTVSIRLYGRDPLELLVSHDLELARRVAHVLDDALQGQFEPLTGAAAPRKAYRPMPIPKLVSIGASAVLFALILASLVFPPLFLLVLLLAIPLGLYFGTQKKDYYV